MIPLRAQQRYLGIILNLYPQEDLMLRLYVNERDPELYEDDDVAQYREMDQHGYQPKLLRGSLWTLLPSTPPKAIYPEQQWVFSGGARTLIYGYYITGVDSGELAWAEAFRDPVTGALDPPLIRSSGDDLIVVPKTSLRAEVYR